ncbi:hypothetical protein M409DRAFT_52894 [Zasmidium cellare ATCC 36951]|uniref:Zn(2)-C6 fungal-type domain-containing protein n=1 Tax=Zasmidium cellare ATCC 36951 TaxID=1080233 RepID=A0A6A6CP76_ZASCE|nr:uncharacterized protein M409DRAFT_52894 [Zasmidium cellare ATCC 36951]KAF2168905.1 hypothetical protein M409DRAFT_52894 [Zasmidium cellare ATCC 36951]
MESTTSKPQRKACDLCYHKKLKCDALKPRCSTCVVYDVECTHKAASRKKGGGVGRREAGAGSVQKGVIKGLEEQLREARREVERLRGKGDVRKVDGGVEGGVRGEVDLVERRSGVQRKGMGILPPYEEAVVLIEEYLSTFNVVFPLFDPREVLQTTRAVYTNNNSASDDPVSWALLNTILALATHTTSSTTLKSSRTQTSTHLSAAQSVLSPIITTPTPALINIQIPLALAMLFYLVADTQPAIILVATALRLAHQIGLHSRAASAHLPPREVEQRNNVFWMAYVLDRDTSMLARVPPIQQDGDIDIDLPPTTLPPPSCPDSPATTGFVFSSPTSTPCTTNFFRLRILLARIQGKVYEYVYSLPATNSPPATRARNIALVLRALDEWTAQIPEAFHAENLSSNCNSNANDPTARYFVILYGTALGCRGVISHASAQDSFHYSQWVGDVRAYGRAVSISNGEVVVEAQPPVEKGWMRLVQESREFMGLFERAALGVGWIEAPDLSRRQRHLRRTGRIHGVRPAVDGHLFIVARHHGRAKGGHAESPRTPGCGARPEVVCRCDFQLSVQNQIVG